MRHAATSAPRPRRALRTAGIAAAALAVMVAAGYLVTEPAPANQDPPSTVDPSGTTPTDGDATASTLAVAAPLTTTLTSLDLLVADLSTLLATGQLPVTLNVDDGEVLGVPVEDGVTVGTYELRSEDGSPAYRVCLTHPDGPWAAFDSQAGEVLADLSGPCVYRSEDLLPAKVEELSTDRQADLTPTRAADLTGLLAAEARTIDAALTDLPRKELPSSLADLERLDDAAPSNAGVSVSTFTSTAGGDYRLCVSSIWGGWALLDSTQDGTIATSLFGTCEDTLPSPAAD